MAPRHPARATKTRRRVHPNERNTLAAKTLSHELLAVRRDALGATADFRLGALEQFFDRRFEVRLGADALKIPVYWLSFMHSLSLQPATHDRLHLRSSYPKRNYQ
jgi:hypothetical protein